MTFLVYDRVNGCVTTETQVLTGSVWYAYAHGTGCWDGAYETDTVGWIIDRTGRCVKIKYSRCWEQWGDSFEFGEKWLAPECLGDDFDQSLPYLTAVDCAFLGVDP